MKPAPGSDYGSKVVEVIGRVLNEDSVEEFKCTLFGDNFGESFRTSSCGLHMICLTDSVTYGTTYLSDLSTYDQMVQLSQTKFRHLVD